MLYLAKSLKELDFRQLMDVYEEGNLENAAQFYPHAPREQWPLLAEQGFYQYLRECFFKKPEEVYAVWTVDGRYASALRLEPYRDGLLLEALETAPSLRGKGCATELIMAVLAYTGGQKVYSHVSKRNRASLHTHEKCGFQRIMEHAVYADGSVLTNSCTLCRVPPIWMETDRLRLRNVKNADALVMYDYRNNESCAQFQRGQTKDLPGIEALVKKHAQDTLDVDGNALVAVALKGTDEMVGEIVVMPSDGTVSLGYTFSYRHHRKGYAFEALSVLIAWMHESYPNWDFISFTEADNIPSRRLLEKLGYTDMGYSPKIESQVYGKWTTRETEEEIARAVK